MVTVLMTHSTAEPISQSNLPCVITFYSEQHLEMQMLQNRILQNITKRERIFHIKVILPNKALRKSEVQSLMYSATLETFLEEKQSPKNTLLCTKVDTKIYKQIITVFVLRAFANARYHDKHLQVLEKTRLVLILLMHLCSTF